MTFRSILILTWLVFVPAVFSLCTAFFLPERWFSDIGTYHTAKGALAIYSTLCFCCLAWSDFLYFMKRLGSLEKTGVSLFIGFFTVFSGYALMFLIAAFTTFLKEGTLDESFFNLNFFPCLFLLVVWFLMRFAFDKKEAIEQE